jgi:hypothetical protein
LSVFGAVEDNCGYPFSLSRDQVPCCLYRWASAAKVAASLTIVFHLQSGLGRLHQELSIRMMRLKRSEMVLTCTFDFGNEMKLEAEPFAYALRLNQDDPYSPIAVNVLSQVPPSPGMCVTVLLHPTPASETDGIGMAVNVSTSKKRMRKKRGKKGGDIAVPGGTTQVTVQAETTGRAELQELTIQAETSGRAELQEQSQTGSIPGEHLAVTGGETLVAIQAETSTGRAESQEESQTGTLPGN